MQENKLKASQIGIAFAIAASPVLMAVLPWDFGSDLSIYRAIMKGFSFTPTFVQLVVIFIALQLGMTLFGAWRGLPKSTRMALPMLGVICLVPLFVGVENSGRMLLALLVFVLHIIFALLIFDLMSGFSIGQRKNLAKWIAIGISAYCAVWAVSFLFFVPEGDEWVALVPGMANVRGLGFFVVSGFFMAMAALPEMEAERAKAPQLALPFLLASVALLLGFWTGSRGSIVAIISAIGLLVLFVPKYRLTILTFGGLALLLGALMSLTLPIPYPSYGIIRFAPVAGEDIALSSGRVAMWLEVIPKILERPLFGWGLDQFQLQDWSSFRGNRQPHNIILQLLFAIGFVGVFLLAVAMLPVVRRARLKTESLAHVSALGVIVATLVFAMYDAALYYNYPLMMLAVAAALAFAPAKPPAVPDR